MKWTIEKTIIPVVSLDVDQDGSRNKVRSIHEYLSDAFRRISLKLPESISDGLTYENVHKIWNDVAIRLGTRSDEAGILFEMKYVAAALFFGDGAEVMPNAHTFSRAVEYAFGAILRVFPEDKGIQDRLKNE